MSKRLQVVLDDSELREFQRIARRNRMTVSEWVRQALRRARAQESPLAPKTRLDHIRAAARHEYPTGEIDEILAEIERGYTSDGAQ